VIQLIGFRTPMLPLFRVWPRLVLNTAQTP
jgi:hypothetical protein